MKNAKLLAALAAIGASFVSFEAQAGVVSDAHGNQGYDTAAECDAAVLNGSAKFYESFTHKPALKRAGEASVQVATLKDLGQQYRMGACDLGVGHKLGRDGVSKALQGKYVPYSPDMPVNVYLDAAGKPVRASMKQCDNWFSGNAPRPVAIPAPKPAPVAVAAPVVAAPVVAAKSTGVRPYVFGSVGALRDGVSTTEADVNFSDRDTAVAGQIGLGAQFNEWLGAEVYYQGGEKHKFETQDKEDSVKVQNHTAAARLTAGTNITDKARVFAKAGVAGVQHRAEGEKETKARATAGVGATYDLTDNVALRADYDHYFKRNGKDGVKWKGADYMGIGAQYKF